MDDWLNVACVCVFKKRYDLCEKKGAKLYIYMCMYVFAWVYVIPQPEGNDAGMHFVVVVIVTKEIHNQTWQMFLVLFFGVKKQKTTKPVYFTSVNIHW